MRLNIGHIFNVFVFVLFNGKRQPFQIKDAHASERRLTLHLYVYVLNVGISSFEDIQLILSVVGVIDGLDYERHNRYAVWSDVDVY